MKDTNIITRQLLDYRLGNNKSPELTKALLEHFLAAEPLHLIYDTQDGHPHEPIFLDSQLAVYLKRKTAEARSETVGLTLPGETHVVVEMGAKKVKSIIEAYSLKRYISAVKLCGNAPITALVEIPLQAEKSTAHPNLESRGGAQSTERPQPVPINPPAPVTVTSQAVEPLTPRVWKLVEDVKKCLTNPSAAERRILDPGQNFENFHTLIRKLIQENGLDLEDVDRALGMQKGMTHNICTDLKLNSSSKEVVRKYLAYFGLEEFIYMFKNDSAEISRELKDSPQIDVYEITRASNKTEEPFKLVAMNRAHVGPALVYHLTLESAYRKQQTIVSSPFKLIVGKEYNIAGLTPIGDGPMSAKSATKGAAKVSTLIVPPEEDEQEILKKLEEEQEKKKGKPQQRQGNQGNGDRMSGKQRYMEETPEEKFEREKNIIIGFIIQTTGCNAHDAQKKFEPLSDYPSIVSDFAKWVKTQKPGGYGIRGYNAARLMNQLHYGPYDAYVMLANLEKDPKKTQEVLKYRETDPQYQKKEKAKERKG